MGTTAGHPNLRLPLFYKLKRADFVALFIYNLVAQNYTNEEVGGIYKEARTCYSTESHIYALRTLVIICDGGRFGKSNLNI